MNKYQTKGMLMYAVGSMQEFTGKITHDSRRQVKGYQKKVTGQAIRALGDAHRALKRCINARTPELEENLEPADRPAKQTSKL